jgi:oligopeptide/dipeptide ABC transporter ATP-binding protein
MLLTVNNLKKYFTIKRGLFSRTAGYVRAVDEVSLYIDDNEVLGLVGESGCGKTTVGKTILRLIEPTAGEILFQGNSILSLSESMFMPFRRNMQIIFQDPLSSLNPRMSVGSIIEEPFIIHRVGAKPDRKEKVIKILDKVGLPSNIVNRYPHEFSGGQRQRIGIARALALNPKLIIADEPVSALDVSIQAQIINLMIELKKELNLSYLFISHDLSVVKHISDRIAVMYLGKIVEIGPSNDIYRNPCHPYTKALLSVVPTPKIKRKHKAIILEGDIPSPSNPPSGCTFHTRCPVLKEECKVTTPELVKNKIGRYVRCPYV